jgi:IS30 family transposase
LLRTMRAMTTWFCDAYASWQNGGVENANGRLRRWLPRQIGSRARSKPPNSLKVPRKAQNRAQSEP